MAAFLQIKDLLLESMSFVNSCAQIKFPSYLNLRGESGYFIF